MSKTAGRPTVITPEVVSILVGCFQDGMTVREACWQSVISHEAYYSRVRSDEQFADTMARAQSLATVDARKVVIEAIKKGDLNTSKWWLERKAPDEFGRNSANSLLEVSNNTNIKEEINLTDEELDFAIFGDEL
jgi:hypothetical protein